MKITTLLYILATVSPFAYGKETRPTFAEVTVSGGAVLTKVVVLKVEPDALRLEHSTGVATVKYEDLPSSIQKQFSFDSKKAESFRKVREADKKARIDAERAADLDRLLGRQRDEQDADLARGRKAFFALVQSAKYIYAELDAQLKDSIGIWKEAGRQDIAEILEEDRVFLRERETKRPDEKYLREREQLLTRIRDLENQVSGLASRPVETQVVHESSTVPIYDTRLYVLPSRYAPSYYPQPIVVNPYPSSPCPVPMRPPLLRSVGAGAWVPPLRVAPSVSSNPNYNAAMANGFDPAGHLWNRK